jgi:hypothetical protein
VPILCHGVRCLQQPGVCVSCDNTVHSCRTEKLAMQCVTLLFEIEVTRLAIRHSTFLVFVLTVNPSSVIRQDE